MDPEFSFDEMIELIRCTGDIVELSKLSKVAARDKYGYSLFHLELIDAALKLRCKYIAQEDARAIKEVLRKFGLI